MPNMRTINCTPRNKNSRCFFLLNANNEEKKKKQINPTKTMYKKSPTLIGTHPNRSFEKFENKG